MAQLESRRSNIEHHIWECECGCCYLRISWDNQNPEYRFLWIETFQRPDKIKARVKTMWRALRGREVGHHEVVLDEPKITSIYNFIKEKM